MPMSVSPLRRELLKHSSILYASRLLIVNSLPSGYSLLIVMVGRQMCVRLSLKRS
jgi:hypothetical protein